MVSLLKSMSSLPLSFGEPLLGVQHEVAAVFLVHLLNLFVELALEPLDARVRLAQLVLEPEHELDAREVEPELRRQPLDDPEPLEVQLRVEPRAARRTLRPDE